MIFWFGLCGGASDESKQLAEKVTDCGKTTKQTSWAYFITDTTLSATKFHLLVQP